MAANTINVWGGWTDHDLKRLFAKFMINIIIHKSSYKIISNLIDKYTKVKGNELKEAAGNGQQTWEDLLHLQGVLKMQ